MDLKGWFEAIELKDIHDFIENQEQEDLHLEFKTVNKTVNKTDLSHPDDRKHFAKALSGFANTSGGIVVWGVSARKNADGIDCAQELKPISQATLFCCKLQELTGAWIDPPIKGVLHRFIRIDQQKDEGFALSYVPESESGPHMVTMNKGYRYYMRVGDSFEPMPHSLVADRFFRKRRPQLTLYVHIHDPTIGLVGNRQFLKFSLIVGLKNEGKAMAKYPYLSIKVNDPFKVSRDGLHKGQDGLTKLRWDRPEEPHRYSGKVDDVVHPESYLEVAKIIGEIQDIENRPCEYVAIDYEMMAEDAEFVSGQERIFLDEIINKARPA